MLSNQTIPQLCCAICCSFLLTINTHAQQPPAAMDAITYKIISCLRSGYDEKILLETDKKMYGAGENIWFSAYVLQAVNNKINNKSRILFADLVDENDAVITRQLLQANRLVTNGALTLPDTLAEGYYWVRAYTLHTVQTNPQSLAIQPVYIVNRKTFPGNKYLVNSMQEAQQTNQSTPRISIYPEGGALISGAESVVALRVTDGKGIPQQAKGIIKDKSGKTVIQFTTNENGLGKFSFSPTLWGRYSAWLFNGTGYDSVIQLPAVNPYAAQLSVKAVTGSNIKVQVLLEDSLFTPGYTTYIAGISRDSICFAGIGKGMYEVNIPLAAFPAGVAHLMLFNEQQQLLSSRDVYIPSKSYQMQFITDKPFYSARQQVQADISVTDASGKPLLAELSVSITDTRIGDSLNSFNIDPLQTLDPASADLMLLTGANGITSTLQQCDTTKPSIPVQANDVLSLSGTVLDTKKQPLATHEVVVMSSEGAMFVLQDTTDDNGRFRLLLPDYYDSTRFSIQVSTMKKEKVEHSIVFDPQPMPSFTTPAGIKQRYFPAMAARVQTMKKQYSDTLIAAAGKGWLPPVTVSADKKKKKVTPVKNPAIITQEMLKKGGFNNVGEAVLRSGKFHIIQNYLMSGSPNGFAPAPTDEPIVVLDGVPVTIPTDDQTEVSPVLAYLKTLTISEIDYVKLLTGTEGGFYGVRGGHGVIEIHTTSKSTDYSYVKGLASVYPKGFQIPPVFSMPDYNNTEIKYAENNPDQRTTISWHAGLFTDANGKATISFFTADARTNYLVRITGITATGEIIFNTFSIARP